MDEIVLVNKNASGPFRGLAHTRVFSLCTQIGLHGYTDIDESRDMQQTLCDFSCSK